MTPLGLRLVFWLFIDKSCQEPELVCRKGHFRVSTQIVPDCTMQPRYRQHQCNLFLNRTAIETSFIPMSRVGHFKRKNCPFSSYQHLIIPQNPTSAKRSLWAKFDQTGQCINTMLQTHKSTRCIFFSVTNCPALGKELWGFNVIQRPDSCWWSSEIMVGIFCGIYINRLQTFEYIQSLGDKLEKGLRVVSV